MNTNFKLTLLFLLIATISSYSQNDFRNGFIITLENDTINGRVNYRSNSKNYESCIFKSKKGKIKYLPHELLGFGYDQNKCFSSQIIEGSFVEVLVIGDLSLFKSESKYHLKKENELFELVSKREIVEENGQVGYKGDKLWRRRAYSLIKDCIENTYDLMSNLRFSEKSITNLVIKYNECKGGGFTEFKASRPWTKFDLGVTFGLNKSVIQTIDDKFEKFDYLEEFYHSIDPSIGIILAISSPRILDKIALQLETHYRKANYSSLVIIDRGGATDYNDTYIEINALSVPLSFKYTFPKKKSDLYLQIGTNFDFHFNSYAKLLSERVIINIVNTYSERPAFRIDNAQFGYWGSIGMLKKYKKFKVGISARYFHKNAFDKTSAFIANNNRISVNLILLKK